MTIFQLIARGRYMKNYVTSFIKLAYLKYSQTHNTPIIPLDECRRFIMDCMLALRAPKKQAKALADVLVEADYRGHYGHGMNRLEILKGVCSPEAVPKILKETPATAWVDGNDGLGVTVATFCMDLAIKKAKVVGTGMVVCKGSNHYGIASMYPLQALKKNLIGFTCTNTSPVVAPLGSEQPAIGTNPLSFAAPALDDNHFVLDMATSAVAMSNVQLEKKTKSEKPSKIVLHPMGGESHSAHKGFGLAILVEVLCGILGGGAYGPKIRLAGVDVKRADLCQCFLAIDPKFFAPEFQDRLSDFLTMLRRMKPVDPNKPVMIPGDPEILHMKAVDEAGGMRYAQEQLDECEKIAARLKVKPLKPKDR